MQSPFCGKIRKGREPCADKGLLLPHDPDAARDRRFNPKTDQVAIDSEGRNYFEEKKVEYNIKKDEQVAKISAQVGFIK